MSVRPHVVIIGSGFGGLNALTRLAEAPVDITVIDRDNYHGFWPLLYEVATAALAADNIAHPIRSICSRYANVRVRLGTLTGVDLDRRVVEVDDELDVPYDYLILAAGSSTSDFGIPGVADYAYPLKTLQDAVRLRNHVLTTFEVADGSEAADSSEAADGSDGLAEVAADGSDGLADMAAGPPGPVPFAGAAREADIATGPGEAMAPTGGPAQPDPGELTIVLIGGGPTGVEMAGALSELITHSLTSDFHYMDVSRARVVLVEMTDHLLPGFSTASQQAALRTLENKGVDVRFGLSLVRVTPEGVGFDDGTFLATRTVIWTAGVQANPVADLIPGEKGRGGTIPVCPDLSLPGHPEVFVIGDLAAATGRDGQQLPQVAQVAIQGGRHTAVNIRRRLAGEATKPFRYRDKGIMATIGRRSAVAELPGGIHLRGTVGWLTWLGVHLLFLVGFRNRLLVLVNWAWNYFTWDRGSRVILDDGSRTPTGVDRA